MNKPNHRKEIGKSACAIFEKAASETYDGPQILKGAAYAATIERARDKIEELAAWYGTTFFDVMQIHDEFLLQRTADFVSMGTAKKESRT